MSGDSEGRQEAAREVRRLLVSVATFCEMCDIKRTRAYDLIRSNKVRSCRLGSSRRIDLDSIYELKDQLLSEKKG